MEAEHQNAVMYHVNNTVKMSRSDAFENSTLVAIVTTVLQGALHSKIFLTAPSTDLMKSKFTMIPITNFIEYSRLGSHFTCYP